MRLRRLNGAASKFEDAFWSGGSLDTLYDKIGGTPQDPMAAVFGAAMREWRRTREVGTALRERASSLMQRQGHGRSAGRHGSPNRFSHHSPKERAT